MTAQAGIAAMAKDLADGRTDSVTLVRQALRCISETNDDWHVFIGVNVETALADAVASDLRRQDGNAIGPLDGVPVAVKDNIDIAGMPTTDGTHFYKDKLRAENAFVVDKLKAAGAVILGKLNMHECALGATTDNPFWGRCANPAVAGATPGGSSGGSAAAVSGRLVPLALGTDTMGSVRIPAAYCGVWGIKPTRGLISTRGLSTLSWTLDTIGVIADNADDLEMGLGAIAGFDPGDLDSVKPPPGWHAIAQDRPLTSVVLGRPLELDQVNCETDVLERYERLLAAATQAGATIKPVRIAGWQPTLARRAGLLISEAEIANRLGDDLDGPGGGFSENLRNLVRYGRNAPGARIAAAYRQIALLRLATLQVLDTVDALILPTAPQRAFLHGAAVPANQADLTALANIAFCPAVAFPLAAGDGGAPFSCQLVGAPFSEARLLGLARQLSTLNQQTAA